MLYLSISEHHIFAEHIYAQGPLMHLFRGSEGHNFPLQPDIFLFSFFLCNIETIAKKWHVINELSLYNRHSSFSFDERASSTLREWEGKLYWLAIHQALSLAETILIEGRAGKVEPVGIKRQSSCFSIRHAAAALLLLTAACLIRWLWDISDIIYSLFTSGRPWVLRTPVLWMVRDRWDKAALMVRWRHIVQRWMLCLKLSTVNCCCFFFQMNFRSGQYGIWQYSYFFWITSSLCTWPGIMCLPSVTLPLWAATLWHFPRPPAALGGKPDGLQFKEC